MDFSGKYVGVLWYGKGYSYHHENAELSFQMEIEEKDNWFEGIALDVAGVGMSPDEAKISGIINGIHIEFNKVYKRRHQDDGNGGTKFMDVEGHPIYYVGTYNDETGYYEGTWNYFALKRVMFFFTKRISVGSGTFQLRKADE